MPTLEEQFTVFIDLLGFKDAIIEQDEPTISKLLLFLSDLSMLRGDFLLKSEGTENVQSTFIRPSITTFSDSIVISYPLQTTYVGLGPDTEFTLVHIMWQVNFLLTQIAAAALNIGFLVRGGATIGSLYHAGGVVFGKALIDAYAIEAHDSKHPRVVLSQEILRRLTPLDMQTADIIKGDDGLYHFDYFKKLARAAAIPSGDREKGIDAWIKYVNDTVDQNITKLENRQRISERDKWSWFTREFRSGVERSKTQRTVPFGRAVAFSE
jgi:hypothetical protein